jgi:type IV pilus assembly protein PilA
MLASVMKRLNDRRDGAADLGEDAGFTLIELMVVLLILAILLAIAIPTFLGVTGGANDRAAQSNLNTGLTTAKSAETLAGQSYTGINAATLHGKEPSITFSDGAVTNQGEVSVWADLGGNGIIMTSPSKNANTCWWVVDNIAYVSDGAASGNGQYVDTTGLPGVTNPTNGVPTATGTYYGKSTGTCNAAASGLTGVTWGSKFPAS